MSARVIIASLVLCACPSKPKAEPSSTEVEAPALPQAADAQIVMHGPYAGMNQHCNAFMELAVAETGASSDELEYGCRTEVRAQGERVPVLDQAALGGSFARAKLFETGHGTSPYVGQLRIALETPSGWYVSDPVLALTQASDQGGLAEGKLQASELDAAPGAEVTFRGLPAGSGAQGVTVACRRSERPAPDCVRLGHDARLSENGTATVGAARYRVW